LNLEILWVKLIVNYNNNLSGLNAMYIRSLHESMASIDFGTDDFDFYSGMKKILSYIYNNIKDQRYWKLVFQHSFFGFKQSEEYFGFKKDDLS